MQGRISRRLILGLAATAGLVGTVACGDARLEQLSTGISRDSVLAIINEGSSGDSLARVYRQESYLLPNKKGNVFLANILFYDKRGRKQADEPDVPRDATMPIVIQDGKVIGWGWVYYDSLAKANNIPTQPRN